MSKQVEAVNHLPDNIYRHPDWATCTMTGQELRETLEYTDGRALIAGRMRDILSEKIAPDLYRVRVAYSEEPNDDLS